MANDCQKVVTPLITDKYDREDLRSESNISYGDNLSSWQHMLGGEPYAPELPSRLNGLAVYIG